MRETRCAATALLMHGGLGKDTAFVELDVDSDADIILCCDNLNLPAHNLSFLCFAADGPELMLPVDDGSRIFPRCPASTRRVFRARLPACLSGPAFELRMETGAHPMQRWQTKRWSQGEPDGFSKRWRSGLGRAVVLLARGLGLVCAEARRGDMGSGASTLPRAQRQQRDAAVGGACGATASRAP